jgi:uncharacterized membrane protein YfcA
MDSTTRLLLVGVLGALAGAWVAEEVRQDMPGWLGALLGAIASSLVHQAVVRELN